MDVSPNRDAVLATLMIGSRVMIRRRMTPAEIAKNIGTPHENTTLTDVVGEVLEISSSHIMVKSRTTTSEIAFADVVAAKRIPATNTGRHAPHRSIGATALEKLAAAGWRGGDDEHLGMWTLRYAGGYTGRANSCLALGDPQLPLSQALGAVSDWYHERSLAPSIQLPLDRGVPTDEDPLVREAGALGWHVTERVSVMTAATSDVLTATNPAYGIHSEVSPDLAASWWSLADNRMLEKEESARTILSGSSAQIFVTLFDEETPIARARMAIQPPWGGLYALYTEPKHRGRGLGTHLLHECARYAEEHGLHSLYLQVATSNEPAIRLYEKAGFSEHHQYIYLGRS